MKIYLKLFSYEFQIIQTFGYDITIFKFNERLIFSEK